MKSMFKVEDRATGKTVFTGTKEECLEFMRDYGVDRFELVEYLPMI